MAACSRSEGEIPSARVRVLAWICLVCVVMMGMGCALTSRGEEIKVRADAGRAAEKCNNGLDDDGNGQVDDGCTCSPGSSQRCFVGEPSRAGKGDCSWGMQACVGKSELGQWEACTGYGTAVSCQRVTTATHSANGDQNGGTEGDAMGQACPASQNGGQRVWRAVHTFNSDEWDPEYHAGAVWGSGPNDVWAVHTQTLMHWNGSAWSDTALGATRQLHGLWGSGPNDVWAVGFEDKHVLIQHWDGSAWSDAPNLAQAPGLLERVWGSGPNDVWAVGALFNHRDKDARGIALHWDGSAWSMIAIPGTRSIFTGVWGTGPRDVWVSGKDYVNHQRANAVYGLHHWDGSAWSPVTESINQNYFGVWASGPKDVWAFGLAGSRRWNGSTWASFPILLPTTVEALFVTVWGSGPKDIWASVHRGFNPAEMVRWDGSNWQRLSEDSQQASYGAWTQSMWATGLCDVWAVTKTGKILRYQ